MAGPTAAGIYARISSDRDGSQAGVRRQVDDCHALADRKGWPVAEVYVDDDISAYSGKARPEYRRMLADLKDGHIDAVIVWHPDRLHRQPKELEEFFDVLDAAGVSHVANCTAGDLDLSTHDGRFTARILGAVARKESDDKSRRISRKALENAREGKVSGGGTRPFGYEPDRITVRPDEAAVIRELARRVLAGESMRSLCIDLDERGILTPAGKPWRQQNPPPPDAVGPHQRPARAPRRDHRRRCVAGDHHPRRHRPAARPAQRPLPQGQRAPRRYLLAGGLARCARCQANLVARPRGDGRRRYVCARGPGFSGCGKTSVLADDLEGMVVAAVLYRLDTPQLAAALTAPSTDPDDDTQRAIDQAQAQLDELAAAYGNQQIRLSEWLTARKPIEARIDRARKRLSRLARTSALDGHIGHGTALRDTWPTLPLSRQQAIVAAVLAHVTVGPAVRGRNRFDPERVTPVWRI